MSIELENAIEVLTDELRGMKNERSGDDYWRRVFVAAAIPEFQRDTMARANHMTAKTTAAEVELAVNGQIQRLAIDLADAILAGLAANK